MMPRVGLMYWPMPAVVRLGFMTGEEYDAAVQPEKMV